MNFMLVLIFAFSAAGTTVSSTAPVRLEFLKGIRRLNTTGFTDFYFFCGVRGQFLVWKLNNAHLTGFEVSHEVGRSLVNTRSNYVYAGTLISSEPAENDHRDMGSIIVISFRSNEHSNFEMTCSNGSLSETIVAGPVTDAVNSSLMYDNNRDIILDYISSSAIVRNRNTHIFICGANFSSQILQANGLRLAFRSAETLGNYRVASASRYTINEQGILVAKEPVQIVSILIVAQVTDVEVICRNGNVQTRLTSNMTLDEEMRNNMKSVIETSESIVETSESVVETSESVVETSESVAETSKLSTFSPANKEPKPTAASTITTAAIPQDNTDGIVGSSKMNGSHAAVHAVAAIAAVLAVFILLTIVSLLVVFFLYYRAIKNKYMIKVLNMKPYDYDSSVKQESTIGNGGQQTSFRDTSLWNLIISNKKMRPSAKPFSMNSFIKLFKPLQAQVEEVLEVKPSQIQAIHEGGSQFAGITTGKSIKPVYVKSDGETFESTEKSVVARQDNPSSYWKVIGGLLKGFLSNTMMKFNSLRVRSNVVDCDVAQVQERGSPMALSSGKLFRQFNVMIDGQTIAPITTTSLMRQTSLQTEDDIFLKESDQCRRRPNANCLSERIPGSALTRGFS